ncbi:MAG: hypothetical protein Q7K54_03195 [Candidatus Parcubacteria bacterium]|nr:hypothetical protein [Candidatus Parcubacteria bacterium]
MNIINEYEVVFESFAERHYIRTFAKKYRRAWDTTLSFLFAEFKFIDALFFKNTAEYITNKDADIAICKTEFKIAGTQESRHGSGNRCIVAIHKVENKVRVLLVYHKNDLGGGSETGNWKNLIKENYPQYSKIL